jgi:hypothetical protein
MKTKSTSLARKSAGVTDCGCKAATLGDGSRRYELANARQWRQSHLNKPVIGWMPAYGVAIGFFDRRFVCLLKFRRKVALGADRGSGHDRERYPISLAGLVLH